MINDEAISFTTLRRFQGLLALKDKRIALLTSALQGSAEHLRLIAQHIDALVEANEIPTTPDQPN